MCRRNIRWFNVLPSYFEYLRLCYLGKILWLGKPADFSEARQRPAPSQLGSRPCFPCLLLSVFTGFLAVSHARRSARTLTDLQGLSLRWAGSRVAACRLRPSKACRVAVPWPGTARQILAHWATREVPTSSFLTHLPVNIWPGQGAVSNSTCRILILKRRCF